MKNNQHYAKYTKLKHSNFNKNFCDIIIFYLFNCPTPNTSIRSKTFDEYGWVKAPAFGKLKKHLLSEATPSLKEQYFPCNKEELSDKFNIVKNIKPLDEYCVFL